MKTNCIFCEIVAGRLPACMVYEDAGTLAFMDIGPIVPGHTLVIPRQHYDPLTDVPVAVLHALMEVVQKIARAQMEALGADGVNIMQANGAAAGQVVPHVHFHVIPRYQDDGHHWNWKARPYADAEVMRDLAQKIKAVLPRMAI